MGPTAKIVYNKQRISPSGEVSLYLRVVIDRHKKDIPLNIRWPVKRIDLAAGKCMARHPEDPQVDDNNLLLGMEVNKAREIFVYYRLSKLPLTMENFLKDYHNELSKDNFLDYMLKKIKRRRKIREIADATYNTHMRVHRKLKSFTEQLPFTSITADWAQEYDAWLNRNIEKRSDSSLNSRMLHHRVIKTYMRLAEHDNVRFIDPYKYFEVKKVRGKWLPIFEDELNRLYWYYKSEDIGYSHKKVLRAFLFDCNTGLRRADLMALTEDWITKDMMRVIPQKTRNSGKVVNMPLSKMAREMLKDAIAAKPKGSRLFLDCEQQTFNKVLKEIAAKLGIKARLHNHVGRHTFATLFYGRTKDLKATQEMMGHDFIGSTEIYTHFDPSTAKKLISTLDEVIKQPVKK